MFSPPACQYLFQAPNHYIFHGAEVYSDSEDETSSSCESDSEDSSCSGDGLEDSTGTEEEAAALTLDGEPGLRDTITHYTLANESTTKAQTDNACESNIQSSTHLEV